MSRPERMYIYIYNHNAREGQLPDLEVGGVGEGAISPRQKNCKQNMGEVSNRKIPVLTGRTLKIDMCFHFCLLFRDKLTFTFTSL